MAYVFMTDRVGMLLRDGRPRSLSDIVRALRTAASPVRQALEILRRDGRVKVSSGLFRLDNNQDDWLPIAAVKTDAVVTDSDTIRRQIREAMIGKEAWTCRDLVNTLGYDSRTISQALCRMAKTGTLVRLFHGTYSLVHAVDTGSPPEEIETIQTSTLELAQRAFIAERKLALLEAAADASDTLPSDSILRLIRSPLIQAPR